ncbi:MAG: hypothetical protein P8017_19130, partial [Deltaproteobacteria bacterium]
IVHIPSDVIAKYDREWGDGLLGDKMHSMVFDNSKIKKFVPDFSADIPYRKGVREIMNWYDSHPEFQVVNQEFNRNEKLWRKLTGPRSINSVKISSQDV